MVALDAESTIETVADGIAPHPTFSEAIKEAGSSRSAARSTCPEAEGDRLTRNGVTGRGPVEPGPYIFGFNGRERLV